MKKKLFIISIFIISIITSLIVLAVIVFQTQQNLKKSPLTSSSNMCTDAEQAFSSLIEQYDKDYACYILNINIDQITSALSYFYNGGLADPLNANPYIAILSNPLAVPYLHYKFDGEISNVDILYEYYYSCLNVLKSKNKC